MNQSGWAVAKMKSYLGGGNRIVRSIQIAVGRLGDIRLTTRAVAAQVENATVAKTHVSQADCEDAVGKDG
ncbi:MAG: hypothetical protein Rhob2KO_32370 [Rhodopirellula baltica]